MSWWWQQCNVEELLYYQTRLQLELPVERRSPAPRSPNPPHPNDGLLRRTRPRTRNPARSGGPGCPVQPTGGSI
eukprot:2060332-Rhodomonas_salina.2